MITMVMIERGSMYTGRMAPSWRSLTPSKNDLVNTLLSALFSYYLHISLHQERIH